jgi:hypothetical protein
MKISMSKKYPMLTLLLFCICFGTMQAQNDKKAIKSVIKLFFVGLETGDTTLLKSTCTENPILQTFVKNKEGNMQVVTLPFSNFVKIIGTPKKDKYHEAIKFKSISIELELATAWTPYTFYLNDKILHCGTNSFQLVKTAQG